MREIAVQQGKDPTKIDSKCPADLVVDHSVQVDFSHIEKLAAKQQLQRHSEQTRIENLGLFSHSLIVALIKLPW